LISLLRVQAGEVMLGRRLAVLLLDATSLVCATLFATALRHDLMLTSDRVEDLAVYLAITFAVAIVVIPISGIDRTVWRLSAFRDCARVTATVAVIVIATVAITFAANRLDGVARSIPPLQLVLSVCALVGMRLLARAHASSRRARRRSMLMRNQGLAAYSGLRTVLVVGLNRMTDLYVQSLDEFAPRKVQVAGLVGFNERHVGRIIGAHKVLGNATDIEAIIRDLDVHGVFVDSVVVTASADALPSEARDALLGLERASGIRIVFLADQLGLREPRSEQAQISTNVVIGAFTNERQRAMTARPYWRLKRLLDFCFSALLLVVLAPVIAVVGVVVLFDVGLPIVFWQVRPGWRGRPLKLYKFRTMRRAHTSDGELLADGRRVSSVGRFLRGTRLDELPQLVNILVGDMSFIGPRPLLPVDQSPERSERLLARPGLTGFAQVVGGRAISAEDKAMLDVWYIRKASLWEDVKIVIATVPMVLFGERTNEEVIERVRKEMTRHKSTPKRTAPQRALLRF
jgi:lipopolysaccharide/colanic/teichoic acid biosynthesis glycosyltransferase